MRALRRLAAGAIVAVAAIFAGGALAAGNVTGLAQGLDELQLFRSVDDYDPAATAGAGELAFPLPILERSDATGMLKIEAKGGQYWVIVDDVTTDVAREVDAACEPKLAGSLVAHGKRGAGEGCQ